MNKRQQIVRQKLTRGDIIDVTYWEHKFGIVYHTHRVIVLIGTGVYTHLDPLSMDLNSGERKYVRYPNLESIKWIRIVLTERGKQWAI